MAATIVFNLLAVFFARSESLNHYRHGLKLSLVTIFVFMGLRYDFGNDYMSYYNLFYEINEYTLWEISSFVLKGNEFGWVYLNKAFAPFGFFSMIVFLSLTSCLVLYKFIKDYVPKEYYWLAVFIFVFQPYNMLVSLSAMRQFVAITIFLFSIKYITSNRPFQYLGLIIFATLFHNTAFFLLIFLPLTFLRWRIRKITQLFVGVIFLLMLLFSSEIQSNIFNLIENNLDEYGSYKESTSSTDVGLGFVLNLIILSPIIYTSNVHENSSSNLFKIFIVHILFIPISIANPMVGRLSFYTSPLLMAVYPLSLKSIKSITTRTIFIILLIFFYSYQFNGFFHSPTWQKHYAVYKTILDLW